MSAVPPHDVALAGMLAAATESEPRIEETADHIRIEADLPAAMSNTIRGTILTTLGAADRYGYNRTSDGDTVWAEIDRRAEQ
ncbi:hypothetical protein ACFWDI_35710 [Streptomyces sp. NPDC060064]|uniref:hypothetical protein n=1 Tax=Streptomyces sp. NPDC060064 TaxID=3347049 RepID=UPI0036CAC25A